MELNKMTGWAISGLATDKQGALSDPRVNAGSPLLTGGASLTDFQSVLTGIDAVTHADPALSDDEPSRAVVHDPVGGIPGVLVVRPVWLPSWHRVGDDIDRAAELGTHVPAARLEFLPSAVWPYSSEFMDAVTGEDLDPPAGAFVRAAASADIAAMDGASRDELARSTVGFDTFEEAQRRTVPRVPSAIRALVKWGRLFHDPAMVNQLRPALYTWWS